MPAEGAIVKNMSGSGASTGERGLLLLADISGYTAFLRAVSDAHGARIAASPEPPPAYRLITSLLDSIVEQVAPPFTVSKLEGDAVFAYAVDAEFPLRGASVLACLSKCYRAYRDRREATENVITCPCAACSMLSTLELKFVLHFGDYVKQRIAGSVELLGPDVTLAHLLLKNRVSDVIGRASYALFTKSAIEELDVPRTDAIPHSEQYEHYSPVESFVFAL
jgi:hypothetical protein